MISGMQRLLPPLLFLPLLAISIVLGLVVPIAGPLSWALRILGVPVAIAGLTLNIGGAGLFNRIGTNIKTFDDPGRLVEEGPFRFTRNPMYLGFTLMLCGAALLVGSLTAWTGAVAFFAAANLWYIPFEEARMRSIFGPQYEDYRRRVPRWLGPVRAT